MDQFTQAMNETWKVVSQVQLPSGRVEVTYESTAFPGTKWSHIPFDGSWLPPVGTVGRIGFIVDPKLELSISKGASCGK